MKKINFLFVLFIMALITSCSDEVNDNTNKDSSLLGSSDYPFYPSICKVSQDEITTKAGIPNPAEGIIARWNDFDEIKIYFMNGNTTLKNKVKEVAEIYEDLTKLTFKYTDNQNESDVRITFSNHNFDSDKLQINWSYLGKQCLKIKKSEPTMNLSIANINDMAEINSISFKASILREFGHMIGMIYEFQRKNIDDPSERIVLDADEIYDWAGVESDKQQIYQIDKSYLNNHFFISELLETEVVFPTFDENSIMLPYIPESWFIIGKGSSKSKTKTDPAMVRKAKERTNVVLYKKDKKYLAAFYPPIKPTVYVPGKTGKITLK